MKRNNLTTAILAGITGVAGIASVSNAVNLNSDGLGQVLVYPYYTVNNSINTLISVVNTTDEAKAVKVRFLEGKNSRECLDFNLYLSPYDVWTSGLVPVTDASGAAVNTKIVTTDNSCTAPAVNNLEFLPFAFTGNFADGIGSSLERCTEGHFEMIEMGIVQHNDAVTGIAAPAANYVSDADYNAILHGASGIPGNCPKIVGNWSPGVSQWDTPSINIGNPTGGLFGSATLINVDAGTVVSYNADAIEDFTSTLNHSDPGSLFPSLKTGDNSTSNIFNNGAVVTDTWSNSAVYNGTAAGVVSGTTSGVQAVSALYMHDHIYGEYEITSGINAKTEWVVTFPTKFAYVDVVGNAFGSTAVGLGTVANIPTMPFTTAISSIGACESYSVSGLFDREEQFPTTPLGDVIPSPRPPGVVVAGPIFCWETNVLQFDKDLAATGDSLVLGSKNTTHLPTPFNNGWVALQFNQATAATDTGANIYTGLPVTGFAVQEYANGALASGLLANYAGLFAHKYSKNIAP